MRHRNALHRLLHGSSWALAGGALLALSFPPTGLYPLAWIALVPLLVRWSSAPSGFIVFRETYAAFLLMAAGAGFWVLLHSSISAALYSGFGLLLVPIGHALAFSVAYGIRRRFGMALGLTALVLNILAAEYLLAHSPYGFPWLILGHTQAAALPFNQIADLGGVGLLSLLVLVTNILGLFFVRALPRPGFIPGWRTLTTLLFLATLSAAAVYGDERRAGLRDADRVLTVGMIQPGDRPETWSIVSDGSRVEKLARMSESLTPSARSPMQAAALGPRAARPTLLIWPEGALPAFPDPEQQQRLYARLTRWTDLRGADLLTGAVARPSPESPYVNAAILFRPRTPPQFYAKVHLIPFAERVPLLSTHPYLDALTMPTPNPRFATGDEPRALQGRDYHVGVVIGAESLYGEHVRQTIAEGADLLVTVAQTGWWGHSPSPEQHLGLSRLRAIETRRALVFSTVSGTSAVIYPDGRIEEKSGWMEEEPSIAEVPLSEETTLYLRQGDWAGRYSLFGSGWLLLLWGTAALFFRRPHRPRIRKRRGR